MKLVFKNVGKLAVSTLVGECARRVMVDMLANAPQPQTFKGKAIRILGGAALIGAVTEMTYKAVDTTFNCAEKVIEIANDAKETKDVKKSIEKFLQRELMTEVEFSADDLDALLEARIEYINAGLNPKIIFNMKDHTITLKKGEELNGGEETATEAAN